MKQEGITYYYRNIEIKVVETKVIERIEFLSEYERKRSMKLETLLLRDFFKKRTFWNFSKFLNKVNIRVLRGSGQNSSIERKNILFSISVTDGNKITNQKYRKTLIFITSNYQIS